MRLSRRGRGCCAAGGRERGPPPPPPRSPFVHQLRLSAPQKAKIAFMTLTLFPIRLFFAAFMMLLAWPFAFIASMGSAERELEKPLSWWRKVVDFLLKAIMRTMWLAGGFHWINVKGRQALPTEAAILTLAPHSSYFDAIPVTMTMASIVMKAESKDIPVWGRGKLPCRAAASEAIGATHCPIAYWSKWNYWSDLRMEIPVFLSIFLLWICFILEL